MICVVCGLCAFLFLCLYVCATRLQSVLGTLAVYDLADL